VKPYCGPTGFRVPHLRCGRSGHASTRAIFFVLRGSRSLALIRRSAVSLAAMAGRGSVAEFMFEQMLYGPGPRPSPGEKRSWDRSIPVLAHDLVQAGLGDVEVLLEHRLPLSSRRVDAILAGRHPVSGAASYVVVELKQWGGAELYEDDPTMVMIDGYGHQPRLQGRRRAGCLTRTAGTSSGGFRTGGPNLDGDTR
jgi:hypothetical protein